MWKEGACAKDKKGNPTRGGKMYEKYDVRPDRSLTYHTRGRSCLSERGLVQRRQSLEAEEGKRQTDPCISSHCIDCLSHRVSGKVQQRISLVRRNLISGERTMSVEAPATETVTTTNGFHQLAHKNSAIEPVLLPGNSLMKGSGQNVSDSLGIMPPIRGDGPKNRPKSAIGPRRRDPDHASECDTKPPRPSTA